MKLPLKLLFFLTAVNILNYFDRYIVHSVEPILNREMALTNEQSGFLVSGFVFGYFIFSPLFGYLGDRWDRRRLMAVGILGWSLATGLTGFTSTFYSFLFARVLVGIGEASFGAIVPGYLKGRIPDTLALNSALSLFYVAIPVGSALGYVAGGKIASTSGWNNLFYFSAIPGLLLAPGFLFLPAEQRERLSEAARESFAAGVNRIMKVPVLRLAIIGYVFNTFALNGVAAFVVRYGSTLGMAEADVSTYFGLILVVTGFIGALGGGRLATKLASRGVSPVRSLLMFTSISTFIGLPFLALAFLVGSPLLFLTCCFFAQLALFAGVAPLNSVLVARAPDGLETLTQGITIFMIQLFGSVVAPIAIGRCADMLGSGMVVTNRNGAALGYALQLATVAMLLSAITWYAAALKERETAAKS